MGDKLFKRGRVWYAWVPREGGGTRAVSTGCTDRKAAAIVRARLEREAADPDHAAKASALTVDILDDYLRSLTRRGRSAATISLATTKAGHLRRLLPPFAADITHQVLEAYVDRRVAEDAQRTTVAKELGRLRGALALARRNGRFDADVAQVIPEIDAPYVPRTRFLAPHELLGLCLALPERRAAHVATIVALALRWGESKRLRGDDVQLPLVRVPGTKTAASARTVPVVGVFRDVLEWALARAPGRDQDRPLFDPWPNFLRDVKAACKRLGYAPVRANDLRRTPSSWLRAEGVEPHLIGALMGHTTSAMVERVYGKLQPEGLRSLLVDRLLAGPLGGESLMRGESVDSGLLGASETDATSEVSACFPEGGGTLCEPSDGLRSRKSSVRIGPGAPFDSGQLAETAASALWGAESLMGGRRAFWARSAGWFSRRAA